MKVLKYSGLFLLLACYLLVTACSSTGGQDGSWFRVKQNRPYVVRLETPGRMTAFELVQSLVLAVNEDIPVANIYENIPARQRGDVKLSSFNRYIALIRRVVRTDIAGLTLLSEEEKAPYLTQTSAQSAETAALAAGSTFFHLNFLDESRRDSTFTVAVQHLEDGTPYLSSAWIEAVLRLYDFIELYFAAIDNNDVSALQALLRQGEVTIPTVTLAEALTNKSRDTIAFYKRRVITSPLDYKLISLLPGSASVEHYATVSLGSARRENRTVTFSDANGLVSVLEKVPSELNTADLQVFYRDTKLFTLGSVEEQASSAIFEPLFGIALSHNAQNCRIVNGVSTFQYRYRGLTVSGEGVCDRHLSWHGVISSASLSYSDFSLGSGLAVGQPVSELYLRYPFARESNYVISGVVDEKQISLVIQVEQGIITKLTLTETP